MMPGKAAEVAAWPGRCSTSCPGNGGPRSGTPRPFVVSAYLWRESSRHGPGASPPSPHSGQRLLCPRSSRTRCQRGHPIQPERGPHRPCSAGPGPPVRTGDSNWDTLCLPLSIIKDNCPQGLPCAVCPQVLRSYLTSHARRMGGVHDGPRQQQDKKGVDPHVRGCVL